MTHCDDYIDNPSAQRPLRRFLRYARWPAYYQMKAKAMGINCPPLFADYQGERIRVVMASRFGDVGITHALGAERGYDARVAVDALTNFSEVA